MRGNEIPGLSHIDTLLAFVIPKNWRQCHGHWVAPFTRHRLRRYNKRPEKHFFIYLLM